MLPRAIESLMICSTALAYERSPVCTTELSTPQGRGQPPSAVPQLHTLGTDARLRRLPKSEILNSKDSVYLVHSGQ